MITSYISGSVMSKRGWKNAALFGVLVMSAGTLASAFASAPVPFILAQMCVGVGLGFAKMGIDVYAVVVSSEADMSVYTANSNASIIVGFSCSALIGALLAGIFGYSGAYIVMSVLGILVFLLIFFFGMDVQQEKKAAAREPAAGKNRRDLIDLHFVSYILFIILPYFFLMMFVDYFFPVYAVSQGVSMEVIGYVMLFYGMATAYIGTSLCERLTKRFSSVTLMIFTLIVLGIAVFVFAVRNEFVLAAAIVLLLGIADGIMPSAQFDYLYHLPLSGRIGFSRTLGIEGFFSSLIGALAPIVFGFVMLRGNFGLVIVAAATFAAALLFFLANRGRTPVQKAGILLCVCLGAAAFSTGPAEAQEEKSDGRLTLCYCQAESYYEFDYQLFDIANAMAERGEISPLPESLHEGSSARAVWAALSAAESDFYRFPAENFIDLSGSAYARLGEDELAETLKETLRFLSPDLVITMGTAAGLAVKESSDLPYMNFLASDPVASGIVADALYSGTDRGWAHVNNGVDVKALSVMYDIFAPESVGIIYDMDNPDAYIYSSASSVDSFAAEKGFRVVPVSVTDNIDDSDEAYAVYLEDMKKAHEELAGAGIDLYILTTSLLAPADFAEVLEPMARNGIPVFSINSTEDVRYGAMAAVEMFDYPNIGRFAANTIAEYAKGASLDSLSQKYDTAPFLVLNIDTLRKTGITLPLELFLSTSVIYDEYREE